MSMLYDLLHAAASGGGGGGGGGATILSGTNTPSSSVGSDGDVYLKYIEASYRLVDYIESSGTQWINTGYNHTVKTVAKMGLSVKQTQPNTWPCMLGSRDSPGSYSFIVSLHLNMYDRDCGQDFFFQPQMPRETYMDIVAEPSQCTWESADSSGIAAITSQSLKNATHPLCLFTIGTSASGDYGSVTRTAMKLYYLDLYEENDLKMMLRPCLDENDEACLIDLLTGQMYRNSGSGTFSYSNPQAPQSLSTPITEAFVKVNGAWQNLIGSDIEDVPGAGGGPNDGSAATV